MKNFLKSKIVVITGASSGIGEAMAKLYAQMGAKVVLGARSGEKLKALSEQMSPVVVTGFAALLCFGLKIKSKSPMTIPSDLL